MQLPRCIHFVRCMHRNMLRLHRCMLRCSVFVRWHGNKMSLEIWDFVLPGFLEKFWRGSKMVCFWTCFGCVFCEAISWRGPSVLSPSALSAMATMGVVGVLLFLVVLLLVVLFTSTTNNTTNHCRSTNTNNQHPHPPACM